MEGARWLNELGLTTRTSLSPIRRGLAPGFVNYKKGCTRLATDQVYQSFAHDRWFSPGTPASSTTKTGRHELAEILLKVALNTKIHIQIQILREMCNNRRPRCDIAWLYVTNHLTHKTVV